MLALLPLAYVNGDTSALALPFLVLLVLSLLLVIILLLSPGGDILEMKIQYRIETFFYRIWHNHKLNRKHRMGINALTSLGGNRPASARPGNALEDRFFFLHECELNADVNLRFDGEHTVNLSRRDMKALRRYLEFSSAYKGKPQDLFQRHGLTLQVKG